MSCAVFFVSNIALVVSGGREGAGEGGWGLRGSYVASGV